MRFKIHLLLKKINQQNNVFILWQFLGWKRAFSLINMPNRINKNKKFQSEVFLKTLWSRSGSWRWSLVFIKTYLGGSWFDKKYKKIISFFITSFNVKINYLSITPVCVKILLFDFSQANGSKLFRTVERPTEEYLKTQD